MRCGVEEEEEEEEDGVVWEIVSHTHTISGPHRVSSRKPSIASVYRTRNRPQKTRNLEKGLKYL